MGKGVSINNNESTGFSHNSPFSAYHRPSEPATPQAPNAQPTQVVKTSTTTSAQAKKNYQNDIAASDDGNEVADIVVNVQPRSSLARQIDTSAAHADNVFDEGSDEDSEIAEIMENVGNKQYPILGYRVVMFTPGEDENETDDDECDDNDKEEIGDDNGYQGDGDYDDDDNDDDTDSELENIKEIVKLTTKDCHSSVARDVNNSRAGSETMNDVLMHCFRPITPVVIRLSPAMSTSDHSIVSTSSAMDNEMSLSQFSPIAISSSSTIGSISDFSVHPSPENITDKNTTTDLSKGITEDVNHPDVLSTALNEAEEGLVTPIKPVLEVILSTSLAEFRASVLVGDKLSVRRYEEWFTKSEDEQFAEILEDFLEENEGNIVDEDMIRGMLADTRDRIAERRQAIREARETIARRGPSGCVYYDLNAIMSRWSRRRSDDESDTEMRLSESNNNVTETTSAVSNGSPNGELMETDDDDDNDSIEVMSIVSDGSSDGDLMETDCGDAEESSSDEDPDVEPSSSGERLCRHISSFFGRKYQKTNCLQNSFIIPSNI